MAIIKACNAKTSVKNTGKECDTSMTATAMLIAIHPSVKFDDDDLEDPVTWLQGLIQERLAFPLFGSKAPIRTITNEAESDVVLTLDDGSRIFLRYGIYNRTFETTSGGFCYAKALQSFNKSGYSLLEIDQQGQLLARKNSDGTYSGFITEFLFAPSPVLADFTTTPYKNRFSVAYSPVEIVNNGIIFEGAAPLLSMGGLIDVELKQVLPATTTILKLSVKTECAEADLLTMFPAETPLLANFIVTNKATGAVVTPSAAAIVAGNLHLTGTYVSGQTYNVTGSAPDIWFDNGIEGYDASAYTVSITIP